MLSLTQKKALAVKKIQEDPIHFVRDYLGCEPWPKQEEILKAIRDNKEVAVASCHAAGKCVAVDERVQLADSRVVCAGDLIGESFKVVSYGGMISEARAYDNGIQPDCFTVARRWSSNASVIRGSQPKTSLSGIFLRSTLLFIAFANIIPWDFHLSTRSKNVLKISIRTYLFLPQHFLYFLPLPHGHGSFG